MIIEITKEDNDIILNHLYKYNQGVDIPDKLAMDCYVKSIELKNDDIIFHTKRIKPILDKDCNITEDTVGSGIGDIGDDFRYHYQILYHLMIVSLNLLSEKLK
jgi:hypothetical protein